MQVLRQKSNVSFGSNYQTAQYQWSLMENKEPKGMVIMVHGYGSHSLYFDSMATALAEQGYLVLSHDLFGHGCSFASIQDLTDFDVLIEEVTESCLEMKQKHLQLPLYAIGYSMGAVILYQVQLHYPQIFNKMLWISPALQPTGKKITAKKVKILSKVFKKLPNFSLPGSSFKPEKLTTDTKFRVEMHKDNLMKTNGLFSKFAVAMMQEMVSVRAECVSCPLKIFVGGQDSIADAKKTLSFASSCNSPCQVFHEARHQLHSEVSSVRDQIQTQAIQWCSS